MSNPTIYEPPIQGEVRRLRKENLTLKKLVTQVTAQRNEMATELEKLREHSYEKYTHKRNQL